MREAWGNISAESIPSPYLPPRTAMETPLSPKHTRLSATQSVDSPPSQTMRLSVTQISIQNDEEATTVQEMVSASYPSGDASDREGPGSPKMGRLSQNSLPCVVGRLFGMLLAALIVLVPSLSYKSTPGGAVVTGALLGLASVLPITMLVMRADSSAHTPWLWCEITVLLANIVCSVAYSFTVRGPALLTHGRWPRVGASLASALCLTIPLIISLSRSSTREDKRRAYLCLLLAGMPLLFVIPAILQLVSDSVAGFFSAVVVFVAMFLGASLLLDRKNTAIAHCVPYAAVYGWAIGASIRGFGFILSFQSLPVLVLNIGLSIFSAFVFWVFSQISHRITTVRDDRAFMLPGFLCVELFKCVLYASSDVSLLSWNFVVTLGFQEVLSTLRNVGATRVMWHRVLLLAGRDTTSDHPFLTRHAIAHVVHYACALGVAETMGILCVYGMAAAETLLSVYGPGGLTCAVARCGAQVDSEILVLFGVVLIGRILFLVGEHALLLRVIEYYQHTLGASLQRNASNRVHNYISAPAAVTLRFNTLVLAGDELIDGELAAETSVGFLNALQDLLGGDSSRTTHALLLIVFVLVISYASVLRNGF